jgi:hypothetical protein
VNGCIINEDIHDLFDYFLIEYEDHTFLEF